MKIGLLGLALISAPLTAEKIVAPTAPMAGHWMVDLRPSADSPPYSKPMDISIAADGRVTGSFYNSDIIAGRAGRGRGRLCLAFRTSDGQGLYHSSACLIDGKMVGQTWAEDRNFIFPWTAER